MIKFQEKFQEKLELQKIDYAPKEKIKICLQLDETISKTYWKTRCLLAEKYIEESPCDPDIYDEQLKAYSVWMDFKKL